MSRAITALAVAAMTVAAVPARAESLITTATSSNVFNSGSKFSSHCVNGYFWVALRNGSAIVIYSSSDGVSWSSQGSIFSFNPGVNRWAVRYQGGVIVAFAFNGGDNTRYYRKATLNTDGTLTWNAAEVAVGAADATSAELNALIANGKPILWRAGPGDAGRFTIGDQLDSPVIWTDTPSAPALGPASIPGNGTNGTQSAGAIFPTGGADPDDLIVLRATSASADTLGSHRLVSIKYDASLNAFDAAWYNVSNLGGTLAEDNTTEVGVYSTDERSHRRFAVVTDASGSLHAIYRTQASTVVHYEKDPGFNDTWARIGGDIIGSSAGKLAITAAAGDNLFLYFESTASPNILRTQRFDGAVWGAPSTLFSGTDLQKSFGVMERFDNCAPAVAFTHGSAMPFDVNFSLDAGACAPLQTSEGAGTITVTAPGNFELTFDTSSGGSINSLFDLVEDPSKTVDLAGGLNPEGLHNFGIRSAGTNYNTTTDAVSARIHLLEATTARVRVRQDAGLDNNNTGNLLAGVRGIGNYSMYPSGRVALNHRRIAYVSVPYENEYSELVVHYTNGVPPLDTWASLFQLAGAGAGTGGDDFTLSESKVANAQADFLQIQSEDWVAGPKHLSAATLTDRTFSNPADRLNAYWYDAAGGTIPAGSVDIWDSLTYFRPNFLDHNDLQVTTRSTDYRTPDDISGADFAAGSRWDEDGNNDGFNEAEAVYTMDADPTNGLTFDMDGGTTTRYSPFFKIRQWRSLSDPASVTLAGTTLANDVDYRASVKPFSRAHASRDIIWYSTLENPSALSTPDVGTAATIIGTPAQAAGRFGGGYFFNGSSDAIRFGNGGFTPDYGMVEFWVSPQSVHTDNTNRTFWYNQGSGSEYFRIRKSSLNDLELEVHDGSSTALVQINSTNFSWVAGEWVHLRAIWDDNQAAGFQIRLYVNGREPAHTDSGTYNGAVMTMSWNHIGNESTGTPFANAIIDEFHLYNNAFAPFERAHGGLTSSAQEFLASTTNNWQPSLFAVDANRRGGYFYFGTDSQFRGLNIHLAQAGIGTPDLVWEYWNGTSWADLESVTGFTDELNDLTQPQGTIYWTADPAGWTPYSVVGGPELYYVRVHGSSAHAYTTFPTEAQIRTDILLLAYCGDITASARTFDVALPLPTAVELSSFEARGVDEAAELSWRTASEMDNLGFHVYRSTTADGPFERVTARLIPGLGSSPAGARYRYVDSGLANGTAYYYELEDVETTGATKRHGPVAATPEPGVSPEPPESAPEEGDADARLTYGEPAASTFRILPRRNGIVLELVTDGFVAVPQADGTVRLAVPGLVDVESSSFPVKRAWVDAIAGRDVKLVSVKVQGVTRFDGLQPSAALVSELVASSRGTVKARQVRRGKRLARREGARLLEVAYQGDAKKALVELSPFTWDGRALQLARTLEVHVAFRGREAPVSNVRRRKGGVSARLVTVEPGLYAIPLADVVGAQRARSARALRLSRQDESVQYHLENGVLYFWSDGAAANPYGDEAIYELELGAPGRTMNVVHTDRPASFFTETVEREENRLYQAGLLEAPDIWLWDVLFAPDTKHFELDVHDLADVANGSRLTLWLQGATDSAGVTDHHVRVSVNGNFVADSVWDGKSPHVIASELGADVLHEGVNTVEVENVGDTGASYSMVMVDRFRVEYPRQASVLDDRTFVIDTTETDAPRWVRSGVESMRSYTGIDAAFRPEIRPVPKTRLQKRGRRAEYLVIGPQAFLRAAAPLVQHRRRQGLTVAVASTEQIAAELGHGELTPQSIKSVISYAYHEWRAPKLRYVVLLGDATYDFKDYLGTGVQNQVPPNIVRTSYLWTASDPSYAAVNGDDLLPDVAIGRLPASTPDELRGVVAKILAYERGEPSPDAPFVLVADNADRAGDFEHDANTIAATLLTGRPTERIYLGELGAAAARAAITSRFDTGASVVSYLGHGGIHLWADENIFGSAEIGGLSPGAQQPLVLTMNCLNGYFHFPYFDALAETLLLPADKGAIAVFSPSGLSLSAPANEYHEALLSELLDGGHRTLGDAVLAAQRRYADSGTFPELLSIFHLFGDPALRLAID